MQHIVTLSRILWAKAQVRLLGKISVYTPKSMCACGQGAFCGPLLYTSPQEVSTTTHGEYLETQTDAWSQRKLIVSIAMLVKEIPTETKMERCLCLIRSSAVITNSRYEGADAFAMLQNRRTAEQKINTSTVPAFSLTKPADKRISFLGCLEKALYGTTLASHKIW